MPALLKKITNTLVARPLLRYRLNVVGTNFRLGYASEIHTPKAFSIGDNFFTGPYAYFSTNIATPIKIGDDVMFGPYCKILGGNHNTTWNGGPMNMAPWLGPGKGIIIESDVWIGAGATILDGAFISEGAVIGAGSVVNNFIPPYSIAAGAPCHPKKLRLTTKNLEILLTAKESKYSSRDVIAAFSERSAASSAPLSADVLKVLT